MRLTFKDQERITTYRNLFAHVARAFYEEVDIVVMDSALFHYFNSFMFETQMLVQSTSLPREMVSRSLNMFQSASLIRVLWTNQPKGPDRERAGLPPPLHPGKLGRLRRP
jgi:hypothetical protein